jgi:hypothetical protein
MREMIPQNTTTNSNKSFNTSNGNIPPEDLDISLAVAETGNKCVSL